MTQPIPYEATDGCYWRGIGIGAGAAIGIALLCDGQWLMSLIPFGFAYLAERAQVRWELRNTDVLNRSNRRTEP